MDLSNPVSRRKATVLVAGLGIAALAPKIPAFAAGSPLIKRPIPHSDELLPAVGLGTAEVFEDGDHTAAASVVAALAAHGSTLIDTAPSYGAAEAVMGDVIAAQNARAKFFLSTKLEDYRTGFEAAEAQGCLARLKTGKLDLLQLHNVRQANQSLAGLNALKAQGPIRYTGVTTTSGRAYDATEAIVRRERPDFLEIDYAIDNRDAEERLLPAALDAGSAVLVALPFGRGRLFRDVLQKPLPDFAAEIDCASWAQFFLKFILGHPAVTAAIPGTSNPAHMIDNLGGAYGRLPDAAMRARMARYALGVP
jgi:aryl-alcohol dehydrogenase-like predicted oxidoreductase